MKTKRKGILLALLLIFTLQLSAQEVDTTSLEYKVGHHIGSWLPFSIIALLAVLVILKSRGQSQDN